MKPIKFLPHVKFQIDEAAEWYESQNPHLFDDFVVEVNAFLRRISESPRQYPIAHPKRRVRRVLLKKFPYVIYFIEKTDHLEIIAVIHGSRSPRYWKRFLS